MSYDDVDEVSQFLSRILPPTCSIDADAIYAIMEENERVIRYASLDPQDGDPLEVCRVCWSNVKRTVKLLMQARTEEREHFRRRRS
jgi:hypothetical protein